MDKYRGEIVSRVSRLDVLGLLNCEGFNVSLIPEIERGEVLIDSRGKGSLQQMPHRRGRPKISLKKPNFKQYMKLFKIIFFTLTSTVNISRLKQQQ
jgi:hypothetical protein